MKPKKTTDRRIERLARLHRLRIESLVAFVRFTLYTVDAERDEGIDAANDGDGVGANADAIYVAGTDFAPGRIGECRCIIVNA